MSRTGNLRVLAYHRVADPDDSRRLDPRLISATPQSFEQQMRYLAKHYCVVSMEDLLQLVESGKALPERAVLITFDDATIDFATNAWPVLKQLRLPATLFVPTAYPDQPGRSFWWDRLYRAFKDTTSTELIFSSVGRLSLATSTDRRQSLRVLQKYVKTLPHTEAVEFVDEVCEKLGSGQSDHQCTLSWNELRQLASEGVTLGAHTQTHPIMTKLAPEKIRQEIVGSQQDLRREIGDVLPIFCYPNGDHDEVVIEILREEGFIVAFTMLDGQNDLRSVDFLRLCRTSITRRTSPFIFSLRLLPLVSNFDRWRHTRQHRQIQP